MTGHELSGVIAQEECHSPNKRQLSAVPHISECALMKKYVVCHIKYKGFCARAAASSKCQNAVAGAKNFVTSLSEMKLHLCSYWIERMGGRPRVHTSERGLKQI